MTEPRPGTMWIHGFHPVREALRRRPHEIERVLIGAHRKGGRRGEIENLCRRRGLELEKVDESRLDELAAEDRLQAVADSP